MGFCELAGEFAGVVPLAPGELAAAAAEQPGFMGSTVPRGTATCTASALQAGAVSCPSRKLIHRSSTV